MLRKGSSLGEKGVSQSNCISPHILRVGQKKSYLPHCIAHKLCLAETSSFKNLFEISRATSLGAVFLKIDFETANLTESQVKMILHFSGCSAMPEK